MVDEIQIALRIAAILMLVGIVCGLIAFAWVMVFEWWYGRHDEEK